MKPDGGKPNADVNTTALSGANTKDWMKKLEAATGKPLELGGAPHASGAGASTNVEQRMIQFRCAETGKPFFVLFTRYSPSHSFQVLSVSKTPDAPSSVSERHTSGQIGGHQKSFDASDFDWTGWFCPHCGHKETFCQCGQCGEYICGKRIRRLPDGTETFACHDGCGRTGVIKGYIESYSASQRNTSASNRAALNHPFPTTKALPGSHGHNLPPGPRTHP